MDDELDPKLSATGFSNVGDDIANAGVNDLLDEGITQRGHFSTFDLEDATVVMLATGLGDEAATALKPEARKLRQGLASYQQATKAANAAPDRHAAMKLKTASNTAANRVQAAHRRQMENTQQHTHPAAVEKAKVQAKTPSHEYAKQTHAEAKPKPTLAERLNQETQTRRTWANKMAAVNAQADSMKNLLHQNPNLVEQVGPTGKITLFDEKTGDLYAYKGNTWKKVYSMPGDAGSVEPSTPEMWILGAADLVELGAVLVRGGLDAVGLFVQARFKRCGK